MPSALEFRLNGRVYRPLFPGVLRPLNADERTDLLESVRGRGVQVPVIVDEAEGLIDGLHRCLTAEQLGLAEIPVRVVSGLSEEDKQALAVELNDCRRNQSERELHGRRRTRAEKRAAIAAVLIESPELSDRAIVEKVQERTGEKVSHPTVRKIRGQVVSSGESFQPPKVTGTDGRKYPSTKPDPVGSGNLPEPTGGIASGNLPEAIPPRKRRPPFDWSALSDKLAPVKRLAASSDGMLAVLMSEAGSPGLVPTRLAAARSQLLEAAELLTEVTTWATTQTAPLA